MTGDPDQNVLSEVNALSSRHFEDEIRDEHPAKKKRHIFQRAIYGLVGIGDFNERDAELSRTEAGDCASLSFGANSASNKRNRPFGGKTAWRDGSIDRQESAIESWTRPIALTGHMRGFAVCQHRYALGSRESQVGRDIEVRIRFRRSFQLRSKERQLQLRTLVCIEGHVLRRFGGDKGRGLAVNRGGSIGQCAARIRDSYDNFRAAPVELGGWWKGAGHASEIEAGVKFQVCLENRHFEQ